MAIGIITTLSPSSITSVGPNVSGSGSNAYATLVSDPPASPDDAASFYQDVTSAGGTQFVYAQFAALSVSPPPAFINSVTLTARINDKVTARTVTEVWGGGAFIGGTVQSVQNVWTTRTFQTRTINPLTGFSWTYADLQGIVAGVAWGVNSGDTSGGLGVTQYYLTIDYTPLPPRIGMPRDAGSRELRLFRRPVRTVQMTVPIQFANIELGDDIVVTDPQAPSPDGKGLLSQPYSRGRYKVIGSEIDLDAMHVNLRALDIRDYYVTFWDGMYQKVGLTTIGNAPRMDLGLSRTYSRGSNKYVEDPVDGRIVLVSPGFEPYAQMGELLEGGTVTQLLANCNFNGGTTSWTVAVNGTGASVAADTTTKLWDPSLSTGSVKLVCGNPVSASDNGLNQTSASQTNGTKCVAAVDHMDDSGNPLHLIIENVTAATFYNGQTKTWTATRTANALPVTPANTKVRDYIAFTLAATGTIMLYPCQAGTGTTVVGGSASTAGQINHVYTAEIQIGNAGGYPTSRTLSTQARLADKLQIESRHGARPWPIKRGTAFFQFAPEWNTADLLVNQVMTFLSMEWEGSSPTDYDRVFYDQATSTLRFRRQLTSVNSDAFIALTAVRNTLYKVAVRWTGPEGEWGLAPYTLSIFLNGTKGTDVVVGAPGVVGGAIQGTLNWDFGFDTTGADPCDSYLRNVWVSPFVFTDTEIYDQSQTWQ